MWAGRSVSRKPTPRATNATRSPREIFIDALKTGLSIGGAAKQAGVDRSTAYRWRDDDDDFARAWDDAIEAGTDALEDALTRRALTLSDKGAMFLLQARRPTKYRQVTRHELTGKNGGPIETIDLTKLNDEDLEALEHIVGKASDAE
jgi:hypothetical protein